MKKVLSVVYILSLRFGFQEPLNIIYPDLVKPSYKKHGRNYKLTDFGQHRYNW